MTASSDPLKDSSKTVLASSSDGGGRGAVISRILENPRIPSAPALALKVFKKLGEEECSIEEISELLSHDPGICAKILGMLNGSIYGRTHAVTSIKKAVVILGKRPLRSLVIGLVLPDIQHGGEIDDGLRAFWRRSLVGAVMAQELAVRAGTVAPDDDMAASLLRDLGMILLRNVNPEQYRPAWTGEQRILADKQCEWEERTFGVDHAELGAALLERWRLPIEIVEPIRFHHRPQDIPELIRPLVERAHLLSFVDRLARLEERCRGAEGAEEIMETARERYGLDRTALEEFLAGVRPRIEEFSTGLGLDIGICPDFLELLTTGCGELVRASVEGTASAQASEIVTSQPAARSQARLIEYLTDQSDEPPPACSILQFEVVGLIGRGAMGTVLKAFDSGLNRQVAIKFMAPELAGSRSARERFALEARCAASLRHEHVVAIHLVGELEGVPFLVMEYVSGASLADHLDVGRPFSIKEIARIARQTALGLAVAHSARMVHRDIKPANILLEEKDLHVRVVDFGLARVLDDQNHISAPGLLVGTPLFMSPEQIDDQPLTGACDQFSLGSVMYTMCTGQLPFQAATMSGVLHAVVKNEPEPIRLLNPEIPLELATIVHRLHQKDPAKRFTSVSELAECLRPFCDS